MRALRKKSGGTQWNKGRHYKRELTKDHWKTKQNAEKCKFRAEADAVKAKVAINVTRNKKNKCCAPTVKVT